jgi:hypothetical protein
MAQPAKPATLVVRRHDPRRVRVIALLVALGWLLTVVAAWGLATRRAAPDFERLQSQHQAVAAELARVRTELERTREAEARANRSDQVSRTANETLEADLRERTEEIALLRSDLAFYERLVGGRGPRQGLNVHQFALRAIGDSRGYAFRLTLAQNLKKAAYATGDLALVVDGVRGSKLETLNWAALSQSESPAPLHFRFKYFQQVDGSLMLPEGFQPNRVTISARSEDGEEVKQAFAWKDALAAGASRDVWQ